MIYKIFKMSENEIDYNQIQDCDVCNKSLKGWNAQEKKATYRCL